MTKNHIRIVSISPYAMVFQECIVSWKCVVMHLVTKQFILIPFPGETRSGNPIILQNMWATTGARKCPARINKSTTKKNVHQKKRMKMLPCIPHTVLFYSTCNKEWNIMDNRHYNDNREVQESPTSSNEEKRGIWPEDHSISKLETWERHVSSIELMFIVKIKGNYLVTISPGWSLFPSNAS